MPNTITKPASQNLEPVRMILSLVYCKKLKRRLRENFSVGDDVVVPWEGNGFPYSGRLSERAAIVIGAESAPLRQHHFGASDATIFSKRGSPRRASQ
jgi:hypothetical protein